ncbi:MAG: hypothetical protein LBK99_26490, partial [Opitutaceae bacterium]|nr:hypothetical protein [Opitutaceae bacterium]
MANSDDYIAIDLGAVKLSGYEQGGYIEIETETDNPVLRLSPAIAEPGNFWGSRQNVEGGAIIKPGARTYRFYLDGIAGWRTNAGRDNLYLFVQDLGGEARGSAHFKITRVTLKPPAADWRKQKAEAYAWQYDWPKVEKIEPLYYEHLERAVDWAQVSSSPTLVRISLDGAWKKKSFGEKTWDYGFLADEEYSETGYDDSGWDDINIPEPPAPDQPGGHFWYRREIELPPLPPPPP